MQLTLDGFGSTAVDVVLVPAIEVRAVGSMVGRWGWADVPHATNTTTSKDFRGGVYDMKSRAHHRPTLHTAKSRSSPRSEVSSVTRYSTLIVAPWVTKSRALPGSFWTTARSRRYRPDLLRVGGFSWGVRALERLGPQRAPVDLHDRRVAVAAALVEEHRGYGR